MAPKTADNRLSKHRRQSTEKGERIVKATTVPFCPGRKRLITINFYHGLFQIEYYKNLCQTNSDIFPNFLLGDRQPQKWPPKQQHAPLGRLLYWFFIGKPDLSNVFHYSSFRRGLEWDFEGERIGRKDREPIRGICTLQVNFKIYGLENAISEKNTKENAVRGQGRVHFFVFPPNNV